MSPDGLVQDDIARKLLMISLKRYGAVPLSRSQIRAAIDRLRPLLSRDVDEGRLVDFAEAKLRVRFGGAAFLDAAPLLPLEEGALLAQGVHGSWPRLRRFWEEELEHPPALIRGFSACAEQTLLRCSVPSVGSRRRRGLVQCAPHLSQELHMPALLCMAIDTGYRLLVVLAESETERRRLQGLVDQQVRGAEEALDGSRVSRAVGVGLLLAAPAPFVVSLTSVSPTGDFNTKVAKSLHARLGGPPVVVVMKKNVSVLRDFLRWVQRSAQVKDGHRPICGVPLLLIDDEVDSTSDEALDSEVSVINGYVRELLASFAQSAYVGYTAAPFANLFIDRDRAHSADFLLHLTPPSNDSGPREVFGL